MNNCNASIGLFDSGLGGLTVMHQLLRVLPHENMVYLGDTARLPYGDKSRETIIRYSTENTEFLLSKQIKMLLVACSTATAYALEYLQQTYELPIIGAIEPAAKAAVRASKRGRIAVLGTKGTIQSGAYEKAVKRFDPEISVVPIACPLFVPLVEERFEHHPATRLIVREYLETLVQADVDTVVLGCTHYPFLKEVIRSELGEDIAIIDSSMACAEEVAAILEERDLKCAAKDGEYRFYVSDDPEKFQNHGRSFLGMPIDHVEQTFCSDAVVI